MQARVRRANSCLRDEAASTSPIRSRFRLFLPATGRPPTGFVRRLKPSRRTGFAAGRRSSAKRHLSAQAGESFRRASRRRRSFAPGCDASASLASSLFPAPAFSAFMRRERFVSWRRRARRAFDAAAVVFALGGASWPRLGSDGFWVEAFRAAGIAVTPLKPANCGFLVDWSPKIRETFAGAPLKNIALSHAEMRVRGEAMVTSAGLEGGAIYALSASLREAIAAHGSATITIDFKPDLSEATLATRLKRKPGQSLSTLLRKGAGLNARRDQHPARSGTSSRRRGARCPCQSLRPPSRRNRFDRPGDLDRRRRLVE